MRSEKAPPISEAASLVSQAGRETAELASRGVSKKLHELPDASLPPALREVRRRITSLEAAGKRREANQLGEAYLRATQAALEALQKLPAKKLTGNVAPSAASRPNLAEGGAAPGRTALQIEVPKNGSRGAVANSDIPGGVGPSYTIPGEAGAARPLAYDPSIPEPSLWKTALRELVSIPETRQKFKQFKKRVREIMAGITDQDLLWSLGRFDKLASQEGILRKNNHELVNQWPDGQLTFAAKPEDFEGATLSRQSLLYLFKQAMDREEPAERYGWAAAYALHNHFPRVSHFMGSTLGERVLKAALKGEPGSMQMGAVWIQEEGRHGDEMEAAYNAVRLPNEPVMKQQGINSVMRPMSAKGARSMMMGRAFAELGAGTAYLVLKANAKGGSNADRALTGIFQDEVYHYVLMKAVNTTAYGLENRFRHLLALFIDSARTTNQEAVDRAVYRRPEMLALVQLAYAMNAIDKRVSRFLKTIPKEELRAAVGPAYATDAALEAAVERGEHVRTRPYRMEQNPDLSFDDVRKLEQRFPGDYSLEQRSIRESEIQAILDEYRRERLTNPGYWKGKKGFVESEGADGSRLLARTLEDGESKLTLSFARPGESPRLRVESGHFVGLDASVAELTLRQIGAVMDAQSAEGLAVALGELRATDPEQQGNRRALYEAVVQKLGPSKAYQAKPLTLINDITG